MKVISAPNSTPSARACVVSVLQLCVKIDAMLIPVVIIIMIYYERARLTGRFVVVVAFGFRLM